MGIKSRRTPSAVAATVELMENRRLLAAHPVGRSALLGKLGDSLAGAYADYQAITAKQTAASAKMSTVVKDAAAAAIPALTAGVVGDDQPSLHVSASGVQLIAYATEPAKAASLAASIKKLGGTGVQVFGAEVDAVVPVSKLQTLSKIKTLAYAVPDTYVVNAGSVTSQGDVADRANIERAVSGLTGAGVLVGIISDSFNYAESSLGYTDNENTDQASGDLPANVSVVTEDPVPGTDEGRAIAQVIYDSAPGATIYFASGEGGPGSIAAAISTLQGHGCKVIINDLTDPNEPMFQDGVAAQAAETAIAAGVTYIVAAGNAGTNSYGAAWSNGVNRAAGSSPATTASGYPTVPYFWGGETFNFAPAGQPVNDTNSFTLGGQQSLNISLQWDQAYFSADNSAGNADQVDIYVLQTVNGVTSIVGGAADEVTAAAGGFNGDPIQRFTFMNPGATGTTATYSLMIATESITSTPGYIKYVDFDGQATHWEYTASAPNNGTIFGTANAAGAIAAGAVSYANTPAYGVSTPVIESYSSTGGTPILFNASGGRLTTPLYRQSPLISGPDQVATTFFGPVSSTTGQHVFAGTSAAAASVAGIAALMQQLAPSASPASIATALDSTALPFAGSTPNNVSGYGLVQANLAASALVGTVTGAVYSDNNSDGILESGEPGIGGVTVYIDINKDGVLDAGDLSTVTAGNGTFSFNNVPTGSQVVRLVTPSGYIALSATSTLTVVGAATTSAVNLGLFPINFTSTAGGVSAGVIADPVNSKLVDITFGSTSYKVTRSLLPSLGFILSGGNNTLTISFANGTPDPASGFIYTASGANDALVINGSSGSDNGTINNNTTSFDSAPISATGIATETVNGAGGNDNFAISTQPSNVALTFNGGTGNDTLNINTALANNGSGVVFNAGTNSSDNNTINISAGSYQFNSDPSLTSSNLTVNVGGGDTALFAPGALGSGFNQRKIAGLNLAASGTAVVLSPVDHADRTILVASNLSMGANSSLDLTGNDMIVTGGNLSAINTLVGNAFNFTAFTGKGITSSTAKADTTHMTAVGVICNNQSGSALYGGNNPFDGESSIPLNAILLKYTYIGDTNLDGKVDGSDYSNIDNGYTNGKTGWFNGDIDYDGVVDGTDYAYMDNVFNNQGPQL